MSFAPLERYRAIVEDFDAFIEHLERPLPTCLLVNRLRTERDDLIASLSQSQISTRNPSWTEEALLYDGDSPGHRIEYFAGLYNVQEEAALLPVHVLDPKPGERVLDLCSAPGNKTAQIAIRMKNRGTVVANDRNYQRMRATRRVLDRLGLVNVVTTEFDGTNFPLDAGLFDAVLVDVPCSCEGTSRKNRSALTWGSVGSMQNVQMALLRRAFRLCRPGGRVVYATCTYAPEENEEVVAAALAEASDFELVPAQIEGFASAPALRAWEARQYPAALRHGVRVYPHHNDTGGFFYAMFRRRESAGEVDYGAAPIPDVLDPEPWIAPVIERFGIPATFFDDYALFRANTTKIHITNADNAPVASPPPHAIGIPFVHTNMRYPKLSTAAAMLLGPAATRHVVELDAAMAERYLRRETIALEPGALTLCDSKGYVMVRWKGLTLGLALLRVREGGGELQSLYPKAWKLAEDTSAFR